MQKLEPDNTANAC